MLPLLVAFAVAADSPQFTVRWHGQSFFQVTTPAGKRIVFDPHAMPEFGRPIVGGDIILCSHRHDDHGQATAVEGHAAARIFHGLAEPKKGRPADWNAVNETVGKIAIRTVPLFHDNESGMKRGKNAAFVVTADGVTFCHLGDLGHDLSPAQVKQIGPVDVLFVPVGGIYTINGETARGVVAAVKPKRLVFPMHYAVPGYDDLLPADEFLDGIATVKRTPDTNEFTFPADAAPPAGGPTTVLLGWKK